MASIALRNKCHSLNPKPQQNLLNFSHLYSSSSSRNDDNGGNGPPKPSIFSSYFIHQQQQQQQKQSSSEFRASIDKLSEFRRRTSSETPFPANSNTQNPNSLQNQYNQSSGNPNPSFQKGGIVSLSYDLIRESLQKIKRKVPVQPNNNNNNNNNNENVVPGKLSLSNLKESFKLKPSVGRVLSENDSNVNESENDVDKGRVIGGLLENLPRAAFGKKIKENEGKKARENDVSKFDLIKSYSHEELGVRLRELRPDTSTLVKNKKGKEGEGVEEGWFSLSELQQRLGKLRELEEKESGVGMSGGLIGDLRKKFQVPQWDENVKNLKIDIVSHMKSPSKEHLVEKYFHPDNMSAAEKLKLELKKVRDEFRMSESDCGSTRVQIAQLTTEILHLSTMLHKKDKHSRRGLQAKVQQRKKLLKYLRRTDWDSYCFVLSKLGLRDNPDYKN